MEIEQLKVGFTCTNDGVLKGGAIGDWVYASSLPENYFKLTNHKIIDVDKSWVFDHNPYVDRESEPNKVIDLKAEMVSL